MTRHSRVLIVEDEFLVADELLYAAENEGLECVGPFARLEPSLHAARFDDVDLAILDARLPDGRIDPVLHTLRGRDIPYAFVVGVREDAHEAGNVSDLIVVKPFTSAEVRRVLSMLSRAADQTRSGSKGEPSNRKRNDGVSEMRKTVFEVAVPFFAGGVVFLLGGFATGAITSASDLESSVREARVDARANICFAAATAQLDSAERGQLTASGFAARDVRFELAAEHIVPSGNEELDRLVRQACGEKLALSVLEDAA